MSHEGGPEQPQRTVAELLAKYGAESGNQPRRRRRRADDMNDTGAQQIIDRVMSESGELQPIRDDTPPPERTSHRRGAARPDRVDDYQRQPEPRHQPPQQPRPQPGQQSSQRLQRPLPPPAAPSHQNPSQQLPRPVPQSGLGPGQQSSSRMPAIARPPEPTAPVRGTPPLPARAPQPSQQLPRPQPSQRVPMPPPAGTRDRNGIRSRLDADAPPPPPAPPMGASAETTEELPRVPGRVPVDGSLAARWPMPPTETPTQYAPAYDPYADQPDEDSGYHSPYPAADPDERYDTGEQRYDSAEYDNLLDEDVRRGDLDGDLGDLDDDPDDLDDLDDLDDDRERSPVREWLIMLGQLALGVVGGAAVWLGFNWLWGFLPAAALVVALLVTTGLVLIVRKIRRAEDLQTTVLAVLVGLVVTVSPAALLLLNR
jgi:hypothetical protein